MENHHRNSEFSHEEWWIFPWFFVCLPEGNYWCSMDVAGPIFPRSVAKSQTGKLIGPASGAVAGVCGECEGWTDIKYVND